MSAIDFEKMRAQMRADAVAKRALAAAASQQTVPPAASAPGGAASASASAREQAEERSRQWPPSQPMTAAHRVGAIPCLRYVADWISEAAAEALMQQLPADGPGWAQLASRRLLNCGGVPHPSGMYAETLPSWFGTVADRLLQTGAFEVSAPPNQVLLNEYDVGGNDDSGGGIAPHNDGPLFDANVAIVTLGSPAVLHFWPRDPADLEANGWACVDGCEPVCSLLLEPCSLLVFSELAYTHHLHGIFPIVEEKLGSSVCNLHALSSSHSPPLKVGDWIQRGRRLSLTVRRVPNVKKHAEEFLTSEDEAEITRRWAWWRRAISEQQHAAVRQPELEPEQEPKPVSKPKPDSEPEPEPEPELEQMTELEQHSIQGLVVFDFDSTLATCDVGRRQLTDAIRHAFGGADRVDQLRKMFERLAILGIGARVLSYNSKRTIKQALEVADLLGVLCNGCNCDDVIVGCEDYQRDSSGRIAGISKSKEINTRWLLRDRTDSTDAISLKRNLLLFSTGTLRVPPQRVMFVDDDPQNTEDVRLHCEGVSVHHVSTANGMREADFEAVVGWAEDAVSTATKTHG